MNEIQKAIDNGTAQKIESYEYEPATEIVHGIFVTGKERRLFFCEMDRVLSEPAPKSMRAAMTAFMPLHDDVLVLPVEDAQETDFKGIGGQPIVRPDTAKQKESEGVVVAVGPGRFDSTGRFVPTMLRPRDRVLFGKYSGTEYVLRGKTLRLMTEEQVLGVIR